MVQRRDALRGQRAVLGQPHGSEGPALRRVRAWLLSGQPHLLRQGGPRHRPVHLRPLLLEVVGAEEPAQHDHPVAEGMGPDERRSGKRIGRPGRRRGRLRVPDGRAGRHLRRGQRAPHTVGRQPDLEHGERALAAQELHARRRRDVRAQPALLRARQALPGRVPAGTHGVGRAAVPDAGGRPARARRHPGRLPAAELRHCAHRRPDRSAGPTRWTRTTGLFRRWRTASDTSR